MDDQRLDALARLHRECLPDSFIGAMGLGYLRAFYRYVARSPREILLVKADDNGHPIAAAVLSLAPDSLNRRLLVNTTLALRMTAHLPRVLPLVFARGVQLPSVLPQLILLFTAPAARGSGHASALIAALEGALRERGVPTYEVRTEAEPSNPALAFYARRGFAAGGISVRFGTPFRVLTRTIPAALNSGTP